MMESLLKRIENNRKAHSRWVALVLCLSMLVSLGTFAGFRQKAVAKTYTKEVLDCPYTQEGAEPVAHVHNDDCYDGETLVCALPEIEAHTHTEACFGEQRTLTCTLAENPGHQHGEGCYAAREEMTCGLEENPGHVHNGTCFNDSGVLICTMAEGDGAHTHTADCFTTVYDLVCEIPEGEGAHTHTDECYSTERVMICDKQELPVHVHDAGCIRTEEITVDEPEETAAPEEKTIPEMPVSDPNADLETASDWEQDFEGMELSGNWARDLILVAATQQGRGESPNNFETILNDAGDAWVTHGYTRYGAWYGVPYAEEWSAMFVSFCLRYAGIPEENVPNNPTAAFMAESFQKGELFAGPDYVPAVGDLIFFDTVDDEIMNIDHMGIVYHVDAEDGTINTVEGDRTNAVATFGYHLDDEQIVGYGILPQNPDYIPTEEENNNDELENLIVTTEQITETTVPAVPMPAQSWERTAGGIKVSVEAPEGAFPENTKIAVTPVNGNSLKDTVSDAVSGEVLEVQAVDITFFDAEGHEIEPAVPIRVSMTPAASEHAEEKTNVVHVDIAQQTAELIEQAEGTEFDNSEVVFDADAFTIYAIVYTYQVDFEYEVDGKVYTSSMPGAENMTLEKIVSGLGIVEEAEIATFVSKIATVGSTNDAVVSVDKDENGVLTVRVLKDGDAQIVITMQDGAEFRIDVSAEGETEVKADNVAISTVGDLYLPENAVANAEVVDGEAAIEAVKAETESETVAESESASATEYTVFDISLDNVNPENYEGFEVTVALDSNITGKDFRLYHVHEGMMEDITGGLALEGPVDDNGVRNLSGFTFKTGDFSDFVLSYTVDFFYGEYEYHLPGGGKMLLSDLLTALGIDISLDEISGVAFTDYSLLGLERVTENTTLYQMYLDEFGYDEVELSESAMMEGSTDEPDRNVLAGDWVITSLAPFSSEETLTLSLQNSEEVSILVEDVTTPTSPGVWDLQTGILTTGPDSDGNYNQDFTNANVTKLDVTVSSAVTSTEQEKDVSFTVALAYELNTDTLNAMKMVFGYPTLTYDLSEWLSAHPEVDISNESGRIRQGRQIIGNYSVQDGKVVLTITNLFWLYQQRSLQGTFELKFNLNEEYLQDEDEWTFHLPGTDEDVTIPFKKEEYETTKVVTYNGTQNEDGTVTLQEVEEGGVKYYELTYTATINSPKQLNSLQFVDKLRGKQELVPGSIQVDYQNYSGAVTQTTGSDADGAYKQFTIDFPNETAISQGTHIVSYKTRIPVSEANEHGTANPVEEVNKADWKANGKTVEGPETKVIPVKPEPKPAEPTVEKLVKNSQGDAGSETLTGKKAGDTLYYEITFGQDAIPGVQEATEWNNGIIHDYMTDNQKLVSGSVEISYDGGSTWEAMPSNGAWDGGVNYSDDGNYGTNNVDVFNYRVPDGKTGAIKVRYSTTLISDAEAAAAGLWTTTEAKNTAETGNYSDYTTVPVKTPDEPTVEKKANNQTGDIGTVEKPSQITYTITYGNDGVPLKGHTISDKMTALQNLSSNVVISFDNNQYSSITVTPTWNSSSFTPGTDEREVFSYTFGDEFENVKGPITITYTTTVITEQQAKDLNLFGVQNLNNEVTVDNKHSTTTAHITTQEPTEVSKTVNGAETAKVAPGETVRYVVTYGKENEDMSGYTLYDQMTNIQDITDDGITLTDAAGHTVTLQTGGQGYVFNGNRVQGTAVYNPYSTAMTNVLEWTVPEGWTGPITATYSATMADKATLNNLGYWEKQTAKNEASTSKGGKDDTTTEVDYGKQPEPVIEKEAYDEFGNVINEGTPGQRVKWVITYGDNTTDMRGKWLEDSMVFLQDLDTEAGVTVYYGAEGTGTAVSMPTTADRWNGNGITYHTDTNVNQGNHGNFEVPVYRWQVPDDSAPVYGPITVVYYTTVISKNEAWDSGATGVLNVWNRGIMDNRTKTKDIPTDFETPPHPEKTAYTGETAEAAQAESTAHVNGSGYTLGEYITYEMTYGDSETKLAGTWYEDYMANVQTLVGNVEYKIGNGQWKTMSNGTAEATATSCDGVKWSHDDGVFNTEERCVFAWDYNTFETGEGAADAVGPITFRYTVKLMTNQEAIDNNLVSWTAVNNTFSATGDRITHSGYVEPELPSPEPKKTVNPADNAAGTDESTGWKPGTEDEQGSALTYTLTYGYEGQWINNPNALVNIYDQMTNLQTMDQETDPENSSNKLPPVVTVRYYTDEAAAKEKAVMTEDNSASFVMPIGNNGVRWQAPSSDSQFGTYMVDVFNYTFPRPEENKPGTETAIGNVYGPITVTYSTHIISENQAKASQVFGTVDVDNVFVNVAKTTGTVQFPTNYDHDGKLVKSGHTKDGEDYFGDDRGEAVTPGGTWTSYDKYDNNIVREENTVYWSILVDVKNENSAFPLENVLVWDQEFETVTINGVQKGSGELARPNDGSRPSEFIDYTKTVITTLSGEVLTPGVDYVARAGDGNIYEDMNNTQTTDGRVYWFFKQLDEPVVITFPSVFPRTFAGDIEIQNRAFIKVGNKQESDSRDTVRAHYQDAVVTKTGTLEDDVITWTVILNPSKARVDDAQPVMFYDTLPAGTELVPWVDGEDKYLHIEPYGTGNLNNGQGMLEIGYTHRYQYDLARERYVEDSYLQQGDLSDVWPTDGGYVQNTDTGFSADISFIRLSWDGGAHDNTGGWSGSFVGVSGQAWEIQYKTKIIDKSAVNIDEDGKITYDNSALFTDNGSTWAGDGSVTEYATNPLHKYEMKNSEDGEEDAISEEENDKSGAIYTSDKQYYWYRVTVNENREQYLQDDSTTMTLSDYIDAKIDLVQGKVFIYEYVNTGSETDPVWVRMDTASDEYAALDYTAPVVSYNDDVRMLQITGLKDRTRYDVEYQVRVRARYTDGMSAADYTIRNTVSLDAAKSWTTTTVGEHKVTESIATMFGSISMIKVDELDFTRTLAGAEFEVYEVLTNVDDETKAEWNSGTGVNDVTVAKKEEEKAEGWLDLEGAVKLGSGRSDDTGEVKLYDLDENPLQGFQEKHLYYWVETAAPEGYILDSTPHYFVMYSNDPQNNPHGEARDLAWTLDNLWEAFGGIKIASLSVDNPWNITNAKTRSILVTKRWADDFDNLYKTRPDSIKVKLIRIDSDGNRAVLKSATLSADENGVWQAYTNYIWNGLPAADENGNPYTYTVEEEKVEGYIAVYSDNQEGIEKGSITITNKQIPSKTNLTIEKVWVDGDGNTLSSTPGSITVTLQQIVTDQDGHSSAPAAATGVSGYVVTLTPTADPETGEMKWTHTWTNLPTKDGAGGTYTYTYTVAEDVPDGYIVSYSDGQKGVIEATASDPLTITNTEAGNLKIDKTFSGIDASQLTDAQKAQIVFTVYQVIGADDSSASRPATDGADQVVATFTYAQMQNGSKLLTKLPTGTYRIEESGTEGMTVSGYKWKTVTFTVKNKLTTNATDGTTADVHATVTKGETTQVTADNYYEYATGNLTIKKTVENVPAEGMVYRIRIKNNDTGSYYSISGAEVAADEAWVEFTADQERTWENIAVGTYTVEEQDASTEGSVWTVSGTSDNVIVEPRETANRDVSNTYEPETIDIPVTKTFEMNKEVYGVDEPTDATITVGLYQQKRKIANAHVKIAESELAGWVEWPESFTGPLPDGIEKNDREATITYDSNEKKWVTKDGEFKDLPKYEVITTESGDDKVGDIYEYSYKVVELSITTNNGSADLTGEYESAVNQTETGAEITNTYKPIKTNLTVEKVWSDGSANHTSDTVTVKLVKAYGEKVNVETKNITVSASFVDNVTKEPAGSPTNGAITVTLKNNSGETVGTVDLAPGQWEYTFNNLPTEKVKEDGYNYDAVTYSVEYSASGSDILGTTAANTMNGTFSDVGTSVTIPGIVQYVPGIAAVGLNVSWETGGKTLPADASVTVTVKDSTENTVFERSYSGIQTDTISLTRNDSYSVSYAWSGTGVTGGTGTASVNVPASSTGTPNPETITATGTVELITVTVAADSTWNKGSGTTTSKPDSGEITVTLADGKSVTLSGPDWNSASVDLPKTTSGYTATATVTNHGTDGVLESVAVTQNGPNIVSDTTVTVRGTVKENNKVQLIISGGSGDSYIGNLFVADESGWKVNGTDEISWNETNSQWFNLSSATFNAEGLVTGTKYGIQTGFVGNGGWTVSGTGSEIKNGGYIIFTAQDGTTTIYVTFGATSLAASNSIVVPRSTLLTAKPTGILGLFAKTAFADEGVTIVGKKDDSKLINKKDVTDSELSGGQTAKVTLNSGSVGWSYTWNELPATETVDGVERYVFYYVEEESTTASGVTTITYTYGTPDSEGRIYRVQIENTVQEQKGSISVTKTNVKDVDTEGSIDTNNTFTFIVKDSTGAQVGTDLAIQKGQTASIGNLPFGIYTVEEQTSGIDIDGYTFKRVDFNPAQDVTIDATTKTVAVTATNYYDKDEEFKTTHDSVTINKLDENNTVLSGATFTLYSTNTEGTLSVPVEAYNGGSFTISTEHTALTNYLPTTDGGSVTLYLKETEAPTGYQLDSTIHNVVITTAISGPIYDLTLKKFVTTTTYTMTIDGVETEDINNTPDTDTARVDNSVTVYKTDGSNPLDGATFGLYDGETKIKEYTGANFTISTEDSALADHLPVAGSSKTLTLKEISAPDGYQRSDAEYSVVITAASATGWNGDHTKKVTTTTYSISINNSDNLMVPNPELPGSLKLKKNVTVNGTAAAGLADNLKGLADGTYTFTIESTNLDPKVTKTVTIEFENGAVKETKIDGTKVELDDGWVVVSGLKADTYTVKEAKPENGTSLVSGIYNPQEIVVTKGDTGTVGTAEFTNNIDTGNFELTKTVSGKTDTTTEFEFEIQLTAPTGVTLAETYAGTIAGESATFAIANDGIVTINNANVKLKNNEVMVINDLPAGTRYTIEEKNVPTGFTPYGNNLNSTIPANNEGVKATAKASVENVFATEGSTTFNVKKKFVGGDLSKNSFTFTLTQVDAENSTTHVTTKLADAVNVTTNSETGGTEQTMSFTLPDTFKFDQTDIGKTYWFMIEETVPENAQESPFISDHVKYANPFRQWVSVAITEKNGGLVVTKSTTEGQPDASFENEQLGKLTVTKTFDGSAASKLTDDQKNAITFSITGPTGFTEITDKPLSEFARAEDGVYTLTLDNIPIGEYFVTESKADFEGYIRKTTYKVDETEATEAKTTITTEGKTIAVTNAYEFTKLTISKAMEKGISTKSFSFTVEVKNADTTAYTGKAWLLTTAAGEDGAEPTPSYTEISFSEEGQYTASVEAGSSITICGLPKDCTYTVTEVSESGFQLVSVDGDATKTEATGAISAIERTAVFVNREVVDVSATKAWKDKDGNTLTGASIPEGAKVTFTLFANDQSLNPARTVELDGVDETTSTSIDESGSTTGVTPEKDDYEGADWTAYFTNLPKYDAEGKEITYSVKETGKWTGFEVEGEDTASSGGIITNKEQSTTLEIVKEDKNGGKKLGGAIFELKELAANQTGARIKDGGIQQTSDATDSTTGKTEFTGLTTGYYQVTEKQAPAGYVLGTDTTFYFKVDDGKIKYLVYDESKTPANWDENPAATELLTYVLAVDATETTAASNATVTVKNTAGTALPQTGGIGTALFTTLGAILSGTAGAALVLKKRKEEQ